ncbi:MAG: TIGR03620 family F420-dependent LLM class oxidoreductase [Actinomycetes bacterium]
MSVNLGRHGIWILHQQLTPELAIEIEQLGYGTIWLGGNPPGDLALARQLLAATQRISFATGIVNVWRFPAADVAKSYVEIERAFPGRFLLGVGIGHPEQLAEFRSPHDTLVRYLDDLDAGGVPVEGRVLAALGPRMLRLAGQRARGASPYLTTPQHTADARAVLGEGPLLAPEQKVVLSSDLDFARSVGRPVVRRPYLELSNYRRNLLRAGFTEDDLDTASDRIIDALALSGDAAHVAAGLNAHLEAGADHVAAQVLTASGRVDESYRAAIQMLAAELGLLATQ